MKFIKLTDLDGDICLVCVDSIQKVIINGDGLTDIMFKEDDEAFEVQEEPEEILALING